MEKTQDSMRTCIIRCAGLKVSVYKSIDSSKSGEWRLDTAALFLNSYSQLVKQKKT